MAVLNEGPMTDEILVLLTAHDGDDSPAVALARNHAELLEQVKVAVWGEPHPADTTNDAGDDMAEGITDTLLETGAMHFEGDPPLRLVRIPVESWFSAGERSAQAELMTDEQIDALALQWGNGWESRERGDGQGPMRSMTFIDARLRYFARAVLANPSARERPGAQAPSTGSAFMPTSLSQEAGVIVQRWSQSMTVNGTPMQIAVTLPCSVDGLCREALREKGRREGREYAHVFLSDWILTSAEGHLLDMTADVSTLPTTAPVYLSRKPGIGG